jgi:histidine triad (HIT) family protein
LHISPATTLILSETQFTTTFPTLSNISYILGAMETSIFTRIINGEIPSHKIFEDAYTFAFLDIHPVTPGHTLVIPKKQVRFVWDLEDEDYRALMETARQVAHQLRTVLGSTYVGEKIEGVDVPHAHVHVIPFTSIDQFRRLPNELETPNHEELAALAAKLAFGDTHSSLQ